MKNPSGEKLGKCRLHGEKNFLEGKRVSINMHAAFILLSLLALKELKSIQCITNSNSNKNEILNSLSHSVIQ